MKSKPPSARASQTVQEYARALHNAEEVFLRRHGWEPCGGEWRHPTLHWAWPRGAAVRLQSERSPKEVRLWAR